jgi:hypothetical protein
VKGAEGLELLVSGLVLEVVDPDRLAKTPKSTKSALAIAVDVSKAIGTTDALAKGADVTSDPTTRIGNNDKAIEPDSNFAIRS